MSAPKRIQLRRTKGWRKPDGAIVVSRPSTWGNRYQPIAETGTGLWRVIGSTGLGPVLLAGHEWPSREEAIADVVNLYRLELTNHLTDIDVEAADYLADLTGHDLACWCPLDQPCHADVLLQLANP